MLTNLTAVAGSAVVLVPAQDPAPPPGKGPEFGNASPVGLVVVLLLLIATVFLIRSMTGRIRRLPESFDPQDPDDSGDPGSSDSADSPDGSDSSVSYPDAAGRPTGAAGRDAGDATGPERSGPG